MIDEVGQFVARDVQKMLDLQGVVQGLGRVGRGKFWIVVTSQEKLTELVGGLEDRRVELARLMDRFPQELQVHLEPSDISEVTSKRVLSKNAEAQTLLCERCSRRTEAGSPAARNLTADIRLPELTAERFVDLYPLLPYQVDFIIQVVSGLRTQGGASKHVGGANRTIIKLAQQLLINPAVNLADQPVGQPRPHRSDLRPRRDEHRQRDPGQDRRQSPGRSDTHPLAPAVCKAICLLQFVQSVHRTAENIAAALHPAVDADSQLTAVKEALEELVGSAQGPARGRRLPDSLARRGRLGDPARQDRCHVPATSIAFTPRRSPSSGNRSRAMPCLGSRLQGRSALERPRESSKVTSRFQLQLAAAGKEYQNSVAEQRTRSQVETKSLFWAAALDDAIDRETVEIHRSQEMLSARSEPPVPTPSSRS